MTDRAAFVTAIEADPDSDLPRLAWADWLDDHGDARDRKRAELIRVQCELTRRPSEEMTDRQERLLDVLARVWPADLLPPDWMFRPHQPDDTVSDLRYLFRRGCLTGLTLAAGDFLRWTGLFAGREPLLDVALTSHGLVPPDLADSPSLARVGFALYAGLGPLLASPHLTGLQAAVCDPDEVEFLAAGRVRRLRVIGVPDTRPTALARTLAGTPGFARLKLLSLDDCGLTATDYRVLIASPHLSPELRLEVDGRGRPRRESAVARDLRTRFPGPPPTG